LAVDVEAAALKYPHPLLIVMEEFAKIEPIPHNPTSVFVYGVN